MPITPDTTVADIATAAPATIRIFQQHQIDFCCGGKIPLDAGVRGPGLDSTRCSASCRRRPRRRRRSRTGPTPA